MLAQGKEEKREIKPEQHPAIKANSLVSLLIRFEQEILFSLDYVQTESQNSSSEKDAGTPGAQPASDRMRKRG